MGKNFFVILKEALCDRFHIEGAVEFVGEGGEGRFAVLEFLQGEGEFGQALYRSAGRGTALVGQGAEFDFAVGSLARPGEGHLSPVGGDIIADPQPYLPSPWYPE